MVILRTNCYKKNYNKIKEYLLKKYQKRKLDELGETILNNIVPKVKTKEQADAYITLLKKMQIDSYQESKITEYIKILKEIKE